MMLTWIQWQAEVVSTLRAELKELVDRISFDDVDWVAWYGFYLEGRSPQAAVSRALERDL
jgi:DNA mismatch repair protein MutH